MDEVSVSVSFWALFTTQKKRWESKGTNPRTQENKGLHRIKRFNSSQGPKINEYFFYSFFLYFFYNLFLCFFYDPKNAVCFFFIFFFMYYLYFLNGFYMAQQMMYDIF